MEFLGDVPAFRERSLKWRFSSFPMVLRSLLEGSGIIMRILAISGSLRAASSNGAVLQAAARLAPAGVEVVHYKGLGDLPHFNPDLDTDDPPEVVRALRYETAGATGF
jgi:hypothetical protein